MSRYLWLWLIIANLSMLTCLGANEDSNVSEFNGSKIISITTYQEATPYRFNISASDLQKIINIRIEPGKLITDAKIRANSEGSNNIVQACNIYDNLTKNWMYSSDMRSGEDYGDYYQYANQSFSLAKNGWTGGGDCDDYAILMASMLEAMGMTARIIMAYGANESHAYPEVLLGNSINDIDAINKIKKLIQIRYNLANLKDVHVHVDHSNHEVWLNLDWGEKPYKSARRHPGFDYFKADTHMAIYAKPNSPKTKLFPAPMALFSVKPSLKINVTEPVIFDASICEEVDTVEKYDWFFGEGSPISGSPDKARRIEHKFKSSGHYKVSLSVIDKEGILIQNSTEIVVIGGPLQENRPRIKSFFATPETIFSDENVSLEWDVENTTNVTIDPGNRKFSSHGKILEKLNNTTIYTMRAVNNEGLSDVKEVRVIVIKRPSLPPMRPKAIFDCPASKPEENETIKLNGSQSVGKIKYYEWNLGDGTIISDKMNVEHNYTQSGTYPITLLVIDDNNLRDYGNCSLTVYPSEPVALFSIKARERKEGEPIVFDASSSRGSSGEVIQKYFWDFGDYTPKGNRTNETHIFDKSGKYPVSLTVTDSKGLKDTKTEDVIVDAVSSDVLFSRHPVKPQVGTEVLFDASSSKPGRRNIISYEWSFGDHTPIMNGNRVNHTYNQSGTYLVKLTVIDEGNSKESHSEWITVEENMPPSPTVLGLESFAFTPNPVCAGDTTKISWKTSGATGVTITPGIGIVEPSGFRILSPKQTMGYTLRAWNTTTNTKPVTVLLRVEQCIEPSTPAEDQTANVIYDFIEESHDQGQWMAGPPDVIFHFADRREDDYRGFAMWKNDLQLNDMTVPAKVLQVGPPDNGYVSGTYRHMNYMVQPYDRLIGKVGFFKGSEAGNVTFNLFLIEGNVYHLLWSRSLSYQDGTANFDVPLGNYAGWQPAICLRVDCNHQSIQNRAIWQDVKIIGSSQRNSQASQSISPKDFASSIFEDWNPDRKLSKSGSETESSAVAWLNSP
jgi:PKD repeat protein